MAYGGGELMDDKPIALFYAYELETMEFYCNAGKYNSVVFTIWNEAFRRAKDAKTPKEAKIYRDFITFINDTIESNGLPGF